MQQQQQEQHNKDNMLLEGAGKRCRMSSMLNFAIHGGTAGCPENVPPVDVIVKCVIYQ